MPDKCDALAKQFLDIPADKVSGESVMDCIGPSLALPFRKVWIVMHRGELHPEGGVRTMGQASQIMLTAAKAGYDLVMNGVGADEPPAGVAGSEMLEM